MRYNVSQKKTIYHIRKTQYALMTLVISWYEEKCSVKHDGNQAFSKASVGLDFFCETELILAKFLYNSCISK
jgi:hypothetical protein